MAGSTDRAGNAAALGNFEHRAATMDGQPLHHVVGGRPLGSAPVMLLVHGFPQNWWSWHRVMPQLGEHFTLLVPDLPGIGLSGSPRNGYTKKALAASLHHLVESYRCGPAHVVGHDVGTMVAYAYAWQFPTRSLTLLDGAIPGIGAWDRIVSDPRLWHFAFHQQRGLPEALAQAGGGDYIGSFILERTHVPGVFSPADLAEFRRAYAHPGAFHAAMEMYRAFPQDVADNRAAGQLPPGLPVLALGGDRRWGSQMADWLRSVSSQVEGGALPECGHFLAEEQPQALANALLAFCIRQATAPAPFQVSTFPLQSEIQ